MELNMSIIAVSGTPGTGKTKFAKDLAKKLKYEYVDVHNMIKKEKLHEHYDFKRKSYVVDEKKLVKFLVKNFKGKFVLDSHLSHYIPKKYAEKCYVLKCDLKVLKKRLVSRKYSKQKIRENLDAEIFDVCLVEALEKGHDVILIDSTKGFKTLKRGK